MIIYCVQPLKREIIKLAEGSRDQFALQTSRIQRGIPCGSIWSRTSELKNLFSEKVAVSSSFGIHINIIEKNFLTKRINVFLPTLLKKGIFL